MPAVAENVILRSGEHAGFSRLVLDFDGEIPAWRLGKSETGYILQVNQEDFTADLSQVFRKISHTHLDNLEFTPVTRQLSLAVSCNCHVTAFNFQNSRLVLDIKEGPAEEGSVFEIGFVQLPEETRGITPMVAPVPARSETNIPEPVHSPSTSLQLPRSTNLQVPPARFPSLNLSAADLRQAGKSTATITRSESESVSTVRPDPEIRRAETERVLLRELERAASQGLLEVRLPDIPPTPPSDPVQVSDPAPETMDKSSDDIRNHLNIDADTSIDRGILGALEGAGIINESLSCSLGEILDIRTWGTPEEITGGLAANRKTLLNARDELEQSAVISLAHAYLYATFGAEASHTLDLLNEDTDEIRALRQIAALSDDHIYTPEGPLADLQNCPNAGSFWAMLTNRVVPAQGVNHDALIEYAMSLPPHLRTLFGSRLIRIYSRSGDSSRAEMLRMAIERTLEHPHPEFSIAQAEIDRSAGRRSEADETLSELIQGNTQLSLEALELFMKSALEQQTTIDPAIVENAEALAFELKGSEAGIRLQYLLARTYSQQQQFQKSTLLLLELEERVQDHDLKFAWEELALLLLTTPSDSGFLASYYRHRKELLQAQLMINTRRNFAERLIALGMTDTGRALLGSQNDLTADDRLLHAQAAYLDEDYESTLNLLQGINGDKAAGLRIDTLAADRDYDTAAQLAEAQQHTEQASDFLWRDGNWEALLADHSSPGRQAAASIMLQREQPEIIPAELPQDLASAQVYLERSQADRATIQSIFQENEVSENQ